MSQKREFGGAEKIMTDGGKARSAWCLRACLSAVRLLAHGKPFTTPRHSVVASPSLPSEPPRRANSCDGAVMCRLFFSSSTLARSHLTPTHPQPGRTAEGTWISALSGKVMSPRHGLILSCSCDTGVDDPPRRDDGGLGDGRSRSAGVHVFMQSVSPFHVLAPSWPPAVRNSHVSHHHNRLLCWPSQCLYCLYLLV